MPDVCRGRQTTEAARWVVATSGSLGANAAARGFQGEKNADTHTHTRGAADAFLHVGVKILTPSRRRIFVIL